MEKVRAELTLFSVEKARTLHLTSFLLSVLFLTIATSQSACGNFDSYWKTHFDRVKIGHSFLTAFDPVKDMFKRLDVFKTDSKPIREKQKYLTGNKTKQAHL